MAPDKTAPDGIQFDEILPSGRRGSHWPVQDGIKVDGTLPNGISGSHVLVQDGTLPSGMMDPHGTVMEGETVQSGARGDLG